MTTDEARDLLGYCVWANARVFAAAEATAPEHLETPVASSFPSIRATLGHIVAAEWVWLRRWLGESPVAMPRWVSDSTLPNLKAHLAAVEAERDAYIERLSDSDLDREVTYRLLSGEGHADPLSSLIRHVVNHSTYHRGQVATQLRQVGRTPPNTDLVAYLHQRA